MPKTTPSDPAIKTTKPTVSPQPTTPKTTKVVPPGKAQPPKK